MISIAEIQRETAAEYGLTRDELLGHDRKRRCVWPRHVAMALCRELTDHSFPGIGRNFDSHHTTVINAVQQVARRARTRELRKMNAVRAKLLARGGMRSHALAQREAATVLEGLAAFLRERSAHLRETA